ncbi:hypothetical protein HY489_00655 [Candidatus Woesearchaeota archaeon]|nr:hypothetical protein [Candidatus Woesearchaeota archaeon]
MRVFIIAAVSIVGLLALMFLVKTTTTGAMTASQTLEQQLESLVPLLNPLLDAQEQFYAAPDTITALKQLRDVAKHYLALRSYVQQIRNDILINQEKLIHEGVDTHAIETKLTGLEKANSQLLGAQLKTLNDIRTQGTTEERKLASEILSLTREMNLNPNNPVEAFVSPFKHRKSLRGIHLL